MVGSVMQCRVGRIIVMGVAGSGKSTVGALLAERCDVPFVDGDVLHSAASVAKMAAGVPLDDLDRGPWLERTARVLAAHDDVVVACSALKRRYRDVLRGARGVRFVFLDVDGATAEDRVGARTDHFVAIPMVAGQFAALERPQPDERDVLRFDGRPRAIAVLSSIEGRLMLATPGPDPACETVPAERSATGATRSAR